MNNKLEKAVNIAVAVAKNDKIGYSQAADQRWTVSRDCSSLVIQAFEDAGIPLKSSGATFTGNMVKAAEKCGFTVIKYQPNIQLKMGDIVINEKHHCILMTSSTQCVMASIDENGHITGGKIGDQTGREIYCRYFYTPSYGWDYILRYDPDSASDEEYWMDIYVRSIPVLKKGSKGDLVKFLQVFLSIDSVMNQLIVDGSFGAKTEAAVKEYQHNHHLTVDGHVGPYTWGSIMKGTKY